MIERINWCAFENGVLRRWIQSQRHCEAFSVEGDDCEQGSS